MYRMKPSFITSTLSLAFILCIVAVLAMIFLRIDPNKELLAVVSSVIAAYLASRNPSTIAQDHSQEEAIEEITTRD